MLASALGVVWKVKQIRDLGGKMLSHRADGPSEVANILSYTSYRIKGGKTRRGSADLDDFVPTTGYNNGVQDVRTKSYTRYPGPTDLEQIELVSVNGTHTIQSARPL